MWNNTDDKIHLHQTFAAITALILRHVRKKGQRERFVRELVKTTVNGRIIHLFLMD